MSYGLGLDDSQFVYRPFTGKIRVSQHAIDRAIERIGVAPDKAEQFIRDNAKKAEFVSMITTEDGRISRLFAYRRVAYIMPPDVDLVVTVYELHYAPSALQQRVETLVKRELAKAAQREQAIERRVRVEKLRLSVEAAQCRYKMAVTPSKRVIHANEKRLEEIDTIVAGLDAELNEARREKTTIAKGLVAYL
ncbi:hypothetical protein ACFQ3Y_08950 [Paenibacillus motobuensis]|uniref:hypothetical protein n=1 Tax=Paenibacillus motobuensis TaxID=295324 RepID=UPI00363C1680